MSTTSPASIAEFYESYKEVFWWGLGFLIFIAFIKGLITIFQAIHKKFNIV